MQYFRFIFNFFLFSCSSQYISACNDDSPYSKIKNAGFISMVLTPNAGFFDISSITGMRQKNEPLSESKKNNEFITQDHSAQESVSKKSPPSDITLLSSCKLTQRLRDRKKIAQQKLSIFLSPRRLGRKLEKKEIDKIFDEIKELTRSDLEITFNTKSPALIAS